MSKFKKMAEIVKPFGDYKTPGPNEGVIRALRKALEEAERGEIVAVSITGINSQGVVHIICDQGSRSRAELLGAAALLQYDISEGWEYEENKNDAG